MKPLTFRMKKICYAFSLATLLATSAANAEVASRFLPTSGLLAVVVPVLKSGFELMVAGNYLQPQATLAPYVSTLQVAGNTTYVQGNTADLDDQFGFQVGVGYIFKNSGNDVQLSWSHWGDTSHTVATLKGPNQVAVTAQGVPIPLGSASQTLTARDRTQFKKDVIDVSVGQSVDIGARVHTRLFTGLRYAYLQDSLQDTYALVDTEDSRNNVTRLAYLRAHFSGLGPRLGMNLHYDLGGHLGLSSQLAASLLADKSHVVPNLETKLGVDYIAPVMRTFMLVTAGYELDTYIDALQTLYSDTDSTQRVSFSGPYLNLMLKI